MDQFNSTFVNFHRAVPEGDDRERLVCRDCRWIHYDNPRIIVTGLCVWNQQVLLCRRAIPPRYGFWTLPGGFMELGETMEDGARREVREEANADVEILKLLATYSIPRIGQVHMVYLAEMKSADFHPGPESLEVKLYSLTADGIPWDDLAFPVNHWVLKDYLSLNGDMVREPFTMQPHYFDDRMSAVPHHPDYPPPQNSAT